MRILFIAPSTIPGASGVGDYTTSLAEECARQGVPSALASLEETLITPEEKYTRTEEHGIPLLRISSSLPWSEKARLLREFADGFHPDWVSLQFVCFGFHPRGLVFSLGRRLRWALPKVKWHVMFHEIWVGRMKGAPWKTRILGWAQMFSIRSTIRFLEPLLCHTSNPTYRNLLPEAGVEPLELPLFGNIPIPDPLMPHLLFEELEAAGLEAPVSHERYCIFGIYGTLHPVWPPEPFLSHVQKACQQMKKTPVFVSIGSIGVGEELWRTMGHTYEPAVRFVRLGHQSPEKIAHFFAGLDFGVAASNYQLIGKSSSAAAMLEHGVPLVANREEFYGLPSDHEPCEDPLVILMKDGLAEKIAAKLPHRPPRWRLDEITEEFLEDIRDGSA